MPTHIKLLITDLDNTLYDWVTYFSASFFTMLNELSLYLDIKEDVLIQEFKEVHQAYENTEQPFAITELPTVKKIFPGLTPEEIVKKLNDPLHSFNRKRKETLQLYDGVAMTLAALQKKGIRIIGHTESTVHNALFRLNKLDVKKYLKHLYALEGTYMAHPISEKNTPLPDDGFVVTVPKEDRKPNPRLIRDICAIEKVSLSEVAYVGDSLTRDISMAKEAGVLAIWAKYGKSYQPESWEKIVKITHWSIEDVKREELLRQKYNHIKPDLSINSFSELIEILI
jgi:phosphoglycolate phosphatase